VSWTDLLIKRRFPPDATFVADLPCPGCGYNLRGARIGGRCPECGTPAEEALVPLRKPDKVGSGLRDLGKSYLALAVLPVAVMGPAGLPLASIVLGFGVTYRLFAAYRLRFEAVLDGYPNVGPRVGALWFAVLGEAATLVVAILAAFAAVQASKLPNAAAAFEAFRNATALLWLLTCLWSLLVASGVGMALADWLDWPSIRREMIAQRILLVGGLIGAPMIGLAIAGAAPGATTAFAIGPLAGWPALAAAAFLILTWAIGLLLTFSGLLHLANAAELARDELEDVVDTGKSEPVYVPPAYEERPDIEME
jgi:hypothetical protein